MTNITLNESSPITRQNQNILFGELQHAAEENTHFAKFFKAASRQKREQLVQTLNAEPKTKEGLIELTDLILLANDSEVFDANSKYRHIDLSNVPNLLETKSAIELLDIFSENQPKYRFALGFLLSQIPTYAIPDNIYQKINPSETKADISIVPGYKTWSLCPEAEPVLEESIKKQAAILVDDIFLVKLIGKVSGLCLKTVFTKSGQIFIAGNWYSPVGETQKIIVKEFYKRQPSINVAGSWALMRPVIKFPSEYRNLLRRNSEELLISAKSYASNLPERLPETIDGLSLQDFREYNKPQARRKRQEMK